MTKLGNGLFHTFSFQDAGRSFGGSVFIEMQFCRIPIGTKKKTIVKDFDYRKRDSIFLSFSRFSLMTSD